jgi:tetratricopeptide (TPR) repeat protein
MIMPDIEAIADYADDCLTRQLSEEKVIESQLHGETLADTKQRLLDNARSWFEVEWRNLKDLVKWAETEQQWLVVSYLPQLLKNFASRRGYQAEMPLLLNMALNAAKQNEDRLGEANTLKAIGDVQQFLDQRTAALENYQQAIEIYRQVGARLGEANVLKELGALCAAANDHEQALIYYQQSAEICCQIQDNYTEGAMYCYIGRTLVRLDRTSAAMVAHQKSIELFDQINMPELSAEIQAELDAIN